MKNVNEQISQLVKERNEHLNQVLAIDLQLFILLTPKTKWKPNLKKKEEII